MTLPQKVPETPPGDIMEQVLLKGDLSKLTGDERVRYYNELCKSLGLNPLTKPFDFMNLGGKLVCYPRRDCADQLRKIHNVTIELVSWEQDADTLKIHARASMPNGRRDEDFGAVPFPKTLYGEARSNALLKCVTKAKRRVTLSICGLGWMDETEVEDIPGARLPAAGPNVMDDANTNPSAGTHSPGSTAAPPSDGSHLTEGGATIEEQARSVAAQGEEYFRSFYRNRSPAEQEAIGKIGEELRVLMDEAAIRAAGEST